MPAKSPAGASRRQDQLVHPATLQRRGAHACHNASRSIPPSGPAGASCRAAASSRGLPPAKTPAVS
eukprot:12429336-Heterocapsa_arctica.AAC.1